MRVLYLEPFDSGSHAEFTRVLVSGLDAEVTALTLPGRHWKWRMRGAVPWWMQAEPDALAARYDVIVASAYVPLAELRGLAPALARVPAVLYFHENQLTYPVREEHAHERDHHFAFTQIVSALAADLCVFNSAHNRDGFITEAERFVRRMPDFVPDEAVAALRGRSRVLGLPLRLPSLGANELAPRGVDPSTGPLIVWPHRWEYDKHPELFFAGLQGLIDRDLPFRVAVCGQSFSSVPDVFETMRPILGDRVVAWGRVEPRAAYEDLLRRADLVVSTADHEFFGAAMVEAAWCGAEPLVPDALAYPEIFADRYRYPHEEAFGPMLEARVRWSLAGHSLRADRRSDFARYHADAMVPRYDALLREVVDQGRMCASS
jgi:glycosyltransferase involved in cell wall biosynthesis